MDDFLTFEFLATYGGAIAATSLITNFLKRFIAWDPKLIALIVAAAVMVCVQIFYTRDFSAGAWALTVFNICLVQSGAIGAYEVVKDRSGKL